MSCRSPNYILHYCINSSGSHFRLSVYVAAFYDSERKRIGFVQYPEQVGDEVNSCVGVGVFQVFVIRVPWKVVFLVPRDRH